MHAALKYPRYIGTRGSTSPAGAHPDPSALVHPPANRWAATTTSVARRSRCCSGVARVPLCIRASGSWGRCVMVTVVVSRIVMTRFVISPFRRSRCRTSPLTILGIVTLLFLLLLVLFPLAENDSKAHEAYNHNNEQAHHGSHEYACDIRRGDLRRVWGTQDRLQRRIDLDDGGGVALGSIG